MPFVQTWQIDACLGKCMSFDHAMWQRDISAEEVRWVPSV
jgi:hypothetical protein